MFKRKEMPTPDASQFIQKQKFKVILSHASASSANYSYPNGILLSTHLKRLDPPSCPCNGQFGAKSSPCCCSPQACNNQCPCIDGSTQSCCCPWAHCASGSPPIRTGNSLSNFLPSIANTNTRPRTFTSINLKTGIQLKSRVVPSQFMQR